MTGVRSTSIAGRLRQFFIDNPDEELRIGDVQSKFGCSEDTARDAITTLCKVNLLESVRVVRLRTKGMATDPQPSRGADETRQPEKETTQ